MGRTYLQRYILNSAPKTDTSNNSPEAVIFFNPRYKDYNTTSEQQSLLGSISKTSFGFPFQVFSDFPTSIFCSLPGVFTLKFYTNNNKIAALITACIAIC